MRTPRYLKMFATGMESTGKGKLRKRSSPNSDAVALGAIDTEVPI